MMFSPITAVRSFLLERADQSSRGPVANNVRTLGAWLIDQHRSRRQRDRKSRGWRLRGAAIRAPLRGRAAVPFPSSERAIGWGVHAAVTRDRCIIICGHSEKINHAPLEVVSARRVPFALLAATPIIGALGKFHEGNLNYAMKNSARAVQTCQCPWNLSIRSLLLLPTPGD
jgi:hypothetical protein